MRQDNEEELEVELEYSLGFGFREMARLFWNPSKQVKYRYLKNISGQSYKHFTLVNYDSRVVKWGIFQSGMTLES